MSVEENLEVFKLQNEIHNRLITLNEVGLGYLKLGQSTTGLHPSDIDKLFKVT